MKNKLFISIIVLLFLVGCGDKTPIVQPTFNNFDMVKVSLSGAKAQIINNKLEFDKSRGCWLVQIKPLKESRIGGMVKKFIGKHEVRAGVGTITVYEAELELWKE